MIWYHKLVSLLFILLPALTALPLTIQYYPQVDTVEWCRQVCNRVQLCYDVVFSVSTEPIKCGLLLKHI